MKYDSKEFSSLGLQDSMIQQDGFLNPVLSVQIPEFKIQDKVLLSKIQFSLSSNELLVVLGRNGAGKSTLLKHITAEIPNPMSKIEMFSKPLSVYKNKELAQRRAVLAQSTPLNFSYEVLEVVLLGRIPHQTRQVETSQDIEIAKSCLEKVGLQAYETRNYLTLSGGEQQRVHFARVLAQISVPDNFENTLSVENKHTDIKTEERLLLLDEPTSSLDIAHQHQTLKIVKDLLKNQLSCIAILHDLNLAAQYADKILILDRGQMVAFGTPEQILTSEILSKAFGHQIHVMRHPHLDCALIV